ncbi:YkgJ family cysteine cluster protein [Vibrio harveyi]|uniref:YkgJ family cysteine cluster protein n=1 Tax=Vibrio harveyi TaxID=669 RepID=UPI003CEB9807
MSKLDIPIGAQKRMKRLMDYINTSDTITLNRIYKDVDAFQNKCVVPVASCSKGCCACCHVPVEVTRIEAQFIAKSAHIPMNDLTSNKTREPDGTPCPLLKNGICSVYEYRPLACRVFASFDNPLNCLDGKKAHVINTVASYAPIEYIAGMLAFVSREENEQAFYADIREWFS